MRKIVYLSFVVATLQLYADDGATQRQTTSLFFYTRLISDAKNRTSVDENFVPNFYLGRYWQFEPGLRIGQTAASPTAYYLLKAELQSKYFYDIARVFARTSQSVTNFPKPQSSQTSEFVAVETKYPVATHLMLFLSVGYVFSATQTNQLNFAPIIDGSVNNFYAFNMALRYLYSKAGFIEAIFGTYDALSIYLTQQPFLQLTNEYAISKRFTFTGYIRYQYSNEITTANNYFIGLGMRTKI